jgi:hypothetical protein
LSGKDGEAGDVCFIVDAAGCSQAEKGPLEARSSSPTGSYWPHYPGEIQICGLLFSRVHGIFSHFAEASL